jgi:hypothetical protein
MFLSVFFTPIMLLLAFFAFVMPLVQWTLPLTVSPTCAGLHDIGGEGTDNAVESDKLCPAIDFDLGQIRTGVVILFLLHHLHEPLGSIFL